MVRRDGKGGRRGSGTLFLRQLLADARTANLSATAQPIAG